MTPSKIKSRFRLMSVLLGLLVLAVAGETLYLVQLHGRLGEASGPSAANAAEIVRVSDAQSPATPSSSDPFTLDPWNDSTDPAGWDPFAEMQRMQQHIDRMMRDSWSRFDRLSPLDGVPASSPALDVIEEPGAYVIKADLPGVEKDGINVSIRDGVLTLEARRTQENTQQNDKGEIVRRERQTGEFQHSVKLPADSGGLGMTTDYANGALTIRVPKTQTQ